MPLLQERYLIYRCDPKSGAILYVFCLADYHTDEYLRDYVLRFYGRHADDGTIFFVVDMESPRSYKPLQWTVSTEKTFTPYEPTT